MRKKTNLNLHRLKGKRPRHKIVTIQTRHSSWPDTFEEIVLPVCSRQIPYEPKRPAVKVFSPFKASQKGVKRAHAKSPFEKVKHSPFSATLSKSPNTKKQRNIISKALFSKADEEVEEGIQLRYLEDDDGLDVLDVNKPENISESINENLDEMIALLPLVVQKLSEANQDKTMLHFFRQVSSGSFPMKNIAFLLWSEVVKWFECENTSLMRYSEDTKKFWKLGYRTFGGQFVHFMSGYKNVDQIISGTAERGLLSSDESEINFAVPSLHVLRSFQPYGIEDNDEVQKPGIFKDMISSVSKAMEGKSCCLTFDGKKIKQGLIQSSGDVDILGFEKGPSVSDKKKKLNRLIVPVEEILNELDYLNEEKDILSLNSNEIRQLKELLLSLLKDISSQILDTNELRKKKEYAKTKLIERSGEENWKNGKFAYAICSIIVFIHDIDNYTEEALQLIEELRRCICYLNREKVVDGKSLNITKCDFFTDIKDPETCCDSNSANSRCVKQRSKEWFDARVNAKVTGSTIYKAVGLEGIKKQKEHFDSVILGLPEEEKQPSVMDALNYGTTNEPNAMATFVGKVLPVLYPGHGVYEEGYAEMGKVKSSPFLIVSPDGSVRFSKHENSTVAGIELKCPLLQVHKEIPSRYLLQCLCEIQVLEVEELIYLSWRPDISTIFKVKRNTDLFNKAYKMAESLYAADKPKRQTKLSDEVKQMKADIARECALDTSITVEFVGIVGSLQNDVNCNTAFASDQFRLSRTNLMLRNVIKILNRYHEICRQPATEAVVFLVCDLDREWRDNMIRCAPVCWFLKGYSLETDIMRNVLETVLDTCKQSGIHIPAISFDGQWHDICVRSSDNKPLTLFQLQKDVWKQTETLSKSEILNSFRQLNKKPEWRFEKRPKEDTTECTVQGYRKVIVTVNEKLHLPRLSERVGQQRAIEQNRKLKSKMINAQETKENDTSDIEELESGDIMIQRKDNFPETDVESLFTMDTDSGNEGTTELTPKIQTSSKIKGATYTTVQAEVKPVNNLAVSKIRKTTLLSSEGNQGTVNETVQSESANSYNALVLNELDAKSILSMLQTDKKCNAKKEWESKRPCDIQEILSSSENVNRLRDTEIRIVVRYINRLGKYEKIKESDSKKIKVKNLCNILEIPCSTADSRRTQAYKKQVKPLAELAFNVVSRTLKKSDLNIVYAEYIWPEKQKKWMENYPYTVNYSELVRSSGVQGAEGNSYTRQENSIESVEAKASCDANNGSEDTWFYSPVFSKSRQQLEVSCIDATHLLTRTRRKCCKGGLDGLTNSAWRKVAKSNATSLSLAMIDSIFEPMSVSVALTHFTESVENEMRLNGDVHAADLCKDVRLWWKAEDDPGIPAEQRVIMRASLRRRLLNYVNFSHFPPAGSHIVGWPAQLWEGIIANIDAKCLLYSLCLHQTYNVRAFSSMMGETYFSELTLYDRRGHGTVSATEFGQFISSSIEKLHMRLDPERVFSYRTSKKNVYKLVGRSDDPCKAQKTPVTQEREGQLHIRDHTFDKQERVRVKSKRKEADISRERNAVKKGSLGVRWEGARRNEGKLLPTLRLGIDI